jgi:hypothetical protein
LGDSRVLVDEEEDIVVVVVEDEEEDCQASRNKPKRRA